MKNQKSEQGLSKSFISQPQHAVSDVFLLLKVTVLTFWKIFIVLCIEERKLYT